VQGSDRTQVAGFDRRRHCPVLAERSTQLLPGTGLSLRRKLPQIRVSLNFFSWWRY
jgi:hypothetical protein